MGRGGELYALLFIIGCVSAGFIKNSVTGTLYVLSILLTLTVLFAIALYIEAKGNFIICGSSSRIFTAVALLFFLLCGIANGVTRLPGRENGERAVCGVMERWERTCMEDRTETGNVKRDAEKGNNSAADVGKETGEEEAEGGIRAAEPAERGNGGTGSRKTRTDKRKKAGAENVKRDAEIRGKGKTAATGGIMERWRERAMERSGGMFSSQREKSVALALLYGDKSAIPPALRKAYTKSGAAHILSLSGLHAGILYSCTELLLMIFGLSYRGKWIRLFASFAIMISYALFTGFSPSVQRAALMIFIAKFTGLSGRSRRRWSGIVYAGFIILLLNPSEAGSAGARLSFAAVIGIILFHPIISAALCRVFGVKKRGFSIPKVIFNMAAVSVACQITTIPLIIHYFKESSDYFILSTFFAIPTVTAVMYLAPVAIAENLLLGSTTAAKAMEWLLKILNDFILYLGQ